MLRTGKLQRTCTRAQYKLYGALRRSIRRRYPILAAITNQRAPQSAPAIAVREDCFDKAVFVLLKLHAPGDAELGVELRCRPAVPHALKKIVKKVPNFFVYWKKICNAQGGHCSEASAPQHWRWSVSQPKSQSQAGASSEPARLKKESALISQSDKYQST